MDPEVSASRAVANESTNLYVKLFQQSGVPYTFVVLIVIRWLVALTGAVLNGSIVWVTRCADSLHGPCNILIAFNACTVLVLSPFLTFGALSVLVPSIPDFIPFSTCFWLQIVPLLFGHLFSCSMLAIAVDRFMGTFFSLWHSRLSNKKLYLTWILGICFFGSALLFLYNLQGVNVSDNNEYVLCLDSGELYKGSVGIIMFYIKLAIILLCILCYLVIWYSVRKNKAKWHGTFAQKILKSLLAMVLLITVGFVLSLFMRILSPLFVDSVQFIYARFASSIISQAVLASNAPMLYIFSQDYRSAYRKHLPWLFNTNTVQHGSNYGWGAAAATRIAVAPAPLQHPFAPPAPHMLQQISRC